MKLSHPLFFSLSAGCQAYLPSLSHRSSGATKTFTVPILHSSTTRNDAAFSAFADSLEEELDTTPLKKSPTKEKSWQAKLEDLLDPKTNLGERQILLSELLSSNEQIQESVMEALANRKVRRSYSHLYSCLQGVSHRFVLFCC